MPDYKEYHKSVSAEFNAYKNRVRNLIDDAHWGEDGRHKEVVLMNYLKRVLPKNISVGTGFIRNNGNITNQIDIIIYDNTIPVLFSEGDFVILVPENVLGIIEVKSKIQVSMIKGIIEKANNNARVICGDSDKYLFNGIFSYDFEGNVETIKPKLEEIDFSEILKSPRHNIMPVRLGNCINNIVLGSKNFLRLWSVGKEGDPLGQNGIPDPYYSLYGFSDELSIAYFVSNLQERLYRINTRNFTESLPKELDSFLYPILTGKESYLVNQIILK